MAPMGMPMDMGMQAPLGAQGLPQPGPPQLWAPQAAAPAVQNQALEASVNDLLSMSGYASGIPAGTSLPQIQGQIQQPQMQQMQQPQMAVPAMSGQAGTKVFVGNLPKDIGQEAIRLVFGTYGTVTNVHIMVGKSKSGQSCAFVEYSSQLGAETAILTLSDKYEIRPGEGP